MRNWLTENHGRRLLIIACTIGIALNLIVWQGIVSLLAIVGVSLVLWTLRTSS